MTAERWFLRGVSLAGSANQGTLEEAECYKNALRLRESYPEAHDNLAVKLRKSVISMGLPRTTGERFTTGLIILMPTITTVFFWSGPEA